MKMKRKAFTLLELLVWVVIASVIAAFSMAGYQGYRDRANMLVDETNQQVLYAAVKLYAYDNNALPGSLSDLPISDMRRAYALVSEGKRPYNLLAYLGAQWRQLWGQRTAWAQFLPARYYNRELTTITCPSDDTPPTGFDVDGRPVGGTSYEINAALAHATLAEFLNPANAGIVLIFESDATSADGAEVDNEVFRHGRGKVAVRTAANGEVSRVQIAREDGKKKGKKEKGKKKKGEKKRAERRNRKASGDHDRNLDRPDFSEKIENHHRQQNSLKKRVSGRRGSNSERH